MAALLVVILLIILVPLVAFNSTEVPFLMSYVLGGGLVGILVAAIPARYAMIRCLNKPKEEVTLYGGQILALHIPTVTVVHTNNTLLKCPEEGPSRSPSCSCSGKTTPQNMASTSSNYNEPQYSNKTSPFLVQELELLNQEPGSSTEMTHNQIQEDTLIVTVPMHNYYDEPVALEEPDATPLNPSELESYC